MNETDNMKFELYHPVKPWDGGQQFGEKHPIYTNMGILGHNGIDEPCPVGTPVRASHKGRVVFVGKDDAGGNMVTLLDESEKFKTVYCHLDKILVTFDQKVSVGDELAKSGNTGLSTGPHLHFMLFEVSVTNGAITNLNIDNGYRGAINPRPYLNGKYAEDEFITLQKRVVELLLKLLFLTRKK